MEPSIEARNLISTGKLRDAATLLDKELTKTKQNDDIWYLRGIVSLKLNNYEAAHECFERALSIRAKPEYHKVIGMAHLEMFEFKQAVDSFLKASELDKKDAENYVYLGICLVFLDDPRSKEFMEKAYLRDKKKTKEMLVSFYNHFFAKDPSIKEGVKKDLKKRIDSIS